MSEPADSLVVHAHLFTMRGRGVGYVLDGAVAIRGGIVAAVGSTRELTERFEASQTIDATDCAVLPGLIDAHMHTSNTAMRGVAQDVADWMHSANAPYRRHVTPAAGLAGTQLNILEALKVGTTTMVDHGTPIPGWAECFEQARVRARLAPTINALGPESLIDYRDQGLYRLEPTVGKAAIRAALDFAHDWHGAADGRITVMLGPQAPEMLTRDQLLQVKRLSDREGLMIHMHVAVGEWETKQIMARHGQRSINYLDRVGYLDDQLLAVHLTEATDDEISSVAQRGVRMVACSGSMASTYGVVPPAQAFAAAGGLVALGSDGVNGGHCSNIFREMRLTALFQKIKSGDPTVMSACQVLRKATVEGAEAVGLGGEVGSLEAGKAADLILVDLTSLSLSPVLEAPVRNIVPNLVYGSSGCEVKTVMVSGELLVLDSDVLVADEDSVRAEAQVQAEAVAQNVMADPRHKAMELLTAMDADRL